MPARRAGEFPRAKFSRWRRTAPPWQGSFVQQPPKTRVVGRRAAKPEYGHGGLEAADNLLQTIRQMPGGRALAPFGVYRFKSHQEADEWLMKMLTRANRGRPR